MPSTVQRIRVVPPVALAVAMAVGAASPAAWANAERFRLAPGSVMQNDDSGHEGTLGSAGGLTYEVVQGYAVAEGDMVLGRIDAFGRLEVPFQSRGLGQRSLVERWPEGIVPYAFHPGLSEIQQDKVEEALERLNDRTRLSLVPTSDPAADGYADYVLFEPSSGCASFVGRQKIPRQDHQSVWVADSCSVGSVIHEVSHAIGLFHEHTRADRDNYIRVDWDNVKGDKEFNFEIYDAGAEMHGEYDYGSIMHYGERYFSANGKRTIVTLEDGIRIGQREALSADDVAAIDAMYATDLALSTDTLLTDRGLEIDVSVVNGGELGAADLLLRVLGEPGTDWTSVSAESGWSCLAHEAELRCERPRLLERASSRFTIVADPETTSASALGFRLESRTLDTDPSDNAINDAAFEDEPDGRDEAVAIPDAAPGTPMAEDGDEGTADEPGTSGETRSPPSIGAARGGAEPDATGNGDGAPPATAAADAGGGGSVGFAPLVLPLLLGARRRRRPRSRMSLD